MNDVAPALQASRSGPHSVPVRGERLMPEPFYVGILSGIMFCLGFSIGAFTVAILAICERH